jgi:hypothetical protein
MRTIPQRFLALAVCAASAVGAHLSPVCFALSSGPQAQANAPGAASRRVGKIKAINGTVITLTQDSGPEINVIVEEVTRLRRIAPGEANVKNATPLEFKDLQVGDLIRVVGIASDDGKSIAAASIVALKAADVEAKRQQDMQDWQKRGVDGPATAVDGSAGTVTIKVRGKDVVIRSSNSTVILRYPADRWKFEDAQPGTFQQIHPGDQVRARGDRSADGSELAAEEIVSGVFPIVSGTVNSIDASSSTLHVHDLLSKKNVVIKITQDSQLHHLPPEMAQMFAMRLKARTAGAMTGGVAGAASSPGSATNSQAAPGGPPTGMAAGGNGGGSRSGGAPDLQRMLSHTPAASLADLHKGDAVIILSTEGTAGVGTAITLLSGVEPILQAAPGAAQAMMLAPWSLGGPAGDAGGP